MIIGVKILKKDKLERGQKMKKKIGISILTIFVLIITTKAAYANNAKTVGTATTTQTVQSQNVVKEEATGQLIEMKEKELKSIENYNDKYGSEAYGMTAYLLDKVRIYSIPFAFVGIAIAAIYQYIIGRKRSRIWRYDSNRYCICYLSSITTCICYRSKRF